MSVSVTITYDDAWVARILPAVYHSLINNEDSVFVQAGLAIAGVDAVDDLTPKNQYRLWCFVNDAAQVSGYEGGLARKTAAETVWQDIVDNFPMDGA